MESRLRKKRKIRLKGTLLENQIYTTLDMSSFERPYFYLI